MVRRRQRERSLFEVLLPDGHKLWPEWLRRIDTLLEDESVIQVVEQAMERRWPQSRRRGRQGTPAEIVIRMLILKHLFGHGPHLAAGDRGFSSAANEQAAADRGVRRVVPPGAGRNPRADGPTKGKPGSGAGNGGVSVVKGASAWSNGAMESDAAATMAWTGCIAGSASGVIADNLINMATVLGRRAAA